MNATERYRQRERVRKALAHLFEVLNDVYGKHILPPDPETDKLATIVARELEVCMGGVYGGVLKQIGELEENPQARRLKDAEAFAPVRGKRTAQTRHTKASRARKQPGSAE